MALAEQAGDEGKFILLFSMMGLANSLRSTGEYSAAFDVGQRSIQLMREAGNAFAEPLAIQGMNAIALEKYELGRQLLNEAISLIREVGNTHRVAGIIKILGDLTRCEGAYTEAQSLYEQSLSIYRDLDTTLDIASVLCSLAHTHMQLGQIQPAIALLNESLALQRTVGNERGMWECLFGFGVLAAVRGLSIQAVQLLTAAVTWATESILNTYPGERLTYEKSLADAQLELTDQEFTEAQREGLKLTIEQAIEIALSMPLVTPFTAETTNHGRPGTLTSREREIASLIARGLSNGEIADELVLSKRTVEKHIANILSKLALTSRAQIVRWAMENGLNRHFL